MTGYDRRIEALRKSNPHPVIDLTGIKYGRLTAVERVKKGKKTWWKCKCQCGKEAVSLSYNLRSGQTQSCGCLQAERTAESGASRAKHGHTRHKKSEPTRTTPTYRTWRCMLDRCRCAKMPNYHLYGGRGITVCPQWQGKDGFVTFLKDMGERPEGKTLDRLDGDGNYEPSNCRWATTKEQCATRRSRKTVA